MTCAPSPLVWRLDFPDTVQMIFYLYDYTSMWDMEVYETVYEKYNVYSDNKDFEK